MIILVTVSSALSVALLVYLVAQAIPMRSTNVKARLVEMGLDGLMQQDQVNRRTRQRSKLKELLHYMGERLEERDRDRSGLRLQLIQAGYRDKSALPLFLGTRLLGTIVLGFYFFLMGTAAGVTGTFALVCGAVGAVGGWFIPKFLLSARVARRQKEIQKALPDASDLLVICVEAGLGLNQALVRVAQEMRHQSVLMSTEIALTNVAIRAGTPREQALNDLATRTGVEDVRSLVTMLVQTERFGTSVARSLRVHAESMRTKRRQRAEEAAAKTTIKMVFPLAFCIFPALFVVVLGPALISIAQTLSQL